MNSLLVNPSTRRYWLSLGIDQHQQFLSDTDIWPALLKRNRLTPLFAFKGSASPPLPESWSITGEDVLVVANQPMTPLIVQWKWNFQKCLPIRYKVLQLALLYAAYCQDKACKNVRNNNIVILILCKSAILAQNILAPAIYLSTTSYH